ncbi:efflux RND transporter permease subunit [Leptospira noumeaensis]|uniref:Efflux RND transporter permease subunit n=1 Tax=Leptospira noumeaensis TaxID=2484964 RepID=A0A4R9HY65_9LEPT|nr:efflux RND transporter permease subunit [Leptospira noumeaensis]TGK77525.1 efflux RND transporter permease subunit [Leptospira noumeaensis]
MKPKFYFMVMLVGSLLGLLGISKINYLSNREREFNGVLVKVEATGADAYKVEEIVTFPIERSLSNIGGIEEIRSTSEVGRSNIYLKFKESIDFKAKSIEIREKLDLVSAYFPREFHKPHILRYDPAQKPIYIASFESKTLSINDLRLYLENKIKPSLSSLEGVNLVEIAGGELEEVQVSCDPFELESYKISLLDVVNRIQDLNKNFQLGHLYSNLVELERSISFDGKYENIFDIQLTPLLVKENGKAILVKDVCKVSKKPRDSSLVSRINGIEKASVFIYGTSDSSIVLLSGQIENTINDYLRKDVSYSVHTDLSRDLFSRLKFFGVILFALGLFFSIRFKFKTINVKYFIITSLLSLFFMFFLISLLKVKVTEVSLTAFLLSLVLFYLYIVHFRFKKKNLAANFLVFFALSLLGVMFFVSYFDRILIKEYLEFCFIFFLSLLVLVVYRFYIYKESPKEKRISKLEFQKLVTFEVIIKKFKVKTTKKIAESKKKYLGNFYIFPASTLFLSILGLIYFINTDFSSKLENEGYEISAVLEFPAGTAFEYSNKITKGVEEKLKLNEGISDVISKVESDRSFIIVKFKENTKIDKALLTSLKKRAGNLEEAYLHFISDLETPLLNEFAYDLSGPDLEILEGLINEISKKLKEKDGVEDVVLRFKPSREELELIYRGDKFTHSGISISEFGEQLRTAIQGGVASKLFIENKEVDIRVRYDETFRKSVRDLSFYKVKNIFKGFVPIEQIIEIRIKKVPSKIYHKDRTRVLSFAVQTDLNAKSSRELLNSIFAVLNSDINYRLTEYSDIGNKSLRDIMFKLFFLSVLISVFLIDYKKEGSFLRIASYKEIFHFFPFFFLLIYFHQSSFGFYLQLGFFVGFSLERAFGKAILSMSVLRELFFLTLIVNLLVPPIFFSFSLLLTTMLIYLFTKRFYYQVSSRWSRGNLLQSWLEILSRIRKDINEIRDRTSKVEKNTP